MKFQKKSLLLVGILAVSTLLSLTAYSAELPYEETQQGNYSYLNPFAHKPATPEAHMEYVRSLLKRGEIVAARKQLEIFVKRWPDSERASAAQKAVGDLYFRQGESKKAFEAYETLIQKYYTGIKGYDSVLENQLAIANAEMERRRMRWIFGGYTAPERAIPYLESIIRNAPQWDRTPEMQYRIGEAYQKNDNHEMAIVAYTVVEYRYPDSAIAEEAAFSKIESLRELVRSTPYSLDLREQAKLAVDLYASVYPDSEHGFEVETFGQALHNASARATYEIGDFYERVPLPPRNDSARIYYEKVIEQYGGTEYAVMAAERLRVFFPGSVAPDGSLVLPKIFPTPEDVLDVEGKALTNRPTWRLPERMIDDSDAIEVTADRMEYQGDLLIAEGRVALQKQGASLRADHVTVNHKTGQVIARGNILMLRDDNLWEGQELVYNYKTKQGDFGESSMYFEPIYITAEDSKRISTNELIMYNALITTCEGENPILYVKAKEVRIIEKEHEDGGTLIKAKNVTFYMGKVPIFYTPRWQRHLGYRVFSFVAGHSGRLGAFLMTRAELHPADWLTSNTHLDYYSSRGVGLGQDFTWRIEEEAEGVVINGVVTNGIVTNGFGSIETYYINDSDPLSSARTSVEEQLTDSTRYRVKMDHHHKFDDETYFITKVHYLSDPLVLKDYFPEEYRDSANPENYAVLQRATADYAAGLRVDKRLNDFYTTVDRIPELDFDWYRAQIKESPWYFENDSSAAFLQQLNGDPDATYRGTNTPPALSDYDSFRLDTYNRVFRPVRIKEFYNLIPRAAYRGTWYSDTVGGSAELRNVLELGALANFKAYKTLNEKSGFYGDGLRHIFEPYVDYNYRPEPNVTPAELFQFDEIDSIGKENIFRFGMRNFIQTKRGESGTRVANFLDVDLFTSYQLEKDGDEEDFGPLEGDMELSLTDHFNIQSDFEYDWYASEFKDFNARFNLRTEDMSEYGVAYRFVNGDRTLFSPYARLFPEEKWSYEFQLQYDSQNSKWYERQFIVRRRFDCTTLGVGLDIDDENEATLWFQFWLNAFPGVGMGMAQ